MRIRGLYLLAALAFVGVIFSQEHHVLLSFTSKSPAMSPYEEAWRLFIKVNRPVNHPSTREPSLYWETWATPSDVFEDPLKKPDWEKLPKRTLYITPLFKSAVALQDPNELRRLFLFRPPCSEPYGQEVRLNKATVKFIAKKGLYNIEGQVAARGKVSFPPESIEIKAFWTVISKKDKSTFYWRKCKHSLYGLTALHITSKEIPNWFWATFEHIPAGDPEKYNPDQCEFINCVDPFGAYPATGRIAHPTKRLSRLFKSAGMESDWRHVWKHYRLVGVQTGFMSTRLLGNSVLEEQFKSTSSCITCHSRSSISSQHKRLLPGPSAEVSYNGFPDPCWFRDEHRRVTFRQLDFVWSLLEAKSVKTRAPSLPTSLNNCGEPLPTTSPFQRRLRISQ